MSDDEQESLMWSPRAEEEIAALMRQIQRLILQHNDTHDPALRISQADVQLHLPAYRMTQRRRAIDQERASDDDRR